MLHAYDMTEDQMFDRNLKLFYINKKEYSSRNLDIFMEKEIHEWKLHQWINDSKKIKKPNLNNR